MNSKLIYGLLVFCILLGSCASDSEETEPISNEPDIEIPDEPSNIPGENFSLNTLQIETSWNTPDRSTVSEDATNFGPTDYYYMDDEVMVLVSKEEDGKRTELKETPGQERALTVPKTLSYTATIHNIPENGVTIAQVHNRGNGVLRPLVRVYLDDDLKLKYKLSDDPDSASEYTTITGPLYQEGDTIHVTVTLENGVASFLTTTTSGSLDQTFVPSDKWLPYANSFYLKAGVYTEGNDTRPEIRFSEFELIK